MREHLNFVVIALPVDCYKKHSKGVQLALIGYARVSTSEQDTALQLDALEKLGVSSVFVESGSGVGPRPELQKALRSLCAGDVLVVWKLDRMARSLSDLLSILNRLRNIGASVRSLTEPIDTSTPIGEFVYQILGAVAQLERSIIRERVLAGQAAARARGKRWGPLPALTPSQEDELVAFYCSSGLSLVDVASAFNVSTATARRTVEKRFPPCLVRPPGRRPRLA